MPTRSELVQHAPPLPERMPEPISGKVKLTDAVYPHVNALYDNDPEIRECIGSLDSKSSPNGGVCFDKTIVAQKVKAHAAKNGANPLVGNAKLSKISTAITYCLRRVGLARSQRIAEARNNLLGSSSAQPAE